MKRITLAAAVLAVLAASSPAFSQTMPPPPTLTVTGNGSVDRMPDQAIVSFAIVTNDDNAGKATSANNAAYNAFVERMSRLGLAASAIRTASYDVSFNPRPPQPNPQFQQRFGYVVTRNVAVTTVHTDQVGAIIDGAVAAGVTNVNGVTFGLHDNRAAYRDALVAAAGDADRQARALADATHVRLGRIQRVAPLGPVVPGPRPVMFNRVATAAAAPVPTEVQPSDLTVQASVSVTYQIMP
ncbi:MAG TPA: SIMPL domain-containing protein [Candidatus Acidoferrum sp.]|nr:SIMPL domain-containing protein [Candidatus Acidoferrum sp.]